MAHGSARLCTCDQQPRAVDACSVHTHALPEIRAEQTARTGESVRAESAYHDWSEAPPSERPLAAQRLAFAKILFHVLKSHGVSRLRFAAMIGVNEKQVRKMLDGRAPIPMASLGVMPTEMALDFTDAVLAMRRGEGRSSLIQRAIEELGRSRDLRAVNAAQRELLELAAKLSELR